MAVFAVLSMGVCAFMSDNVEDSNAGYVISGEKDYVETGGTITLKVDNLTGNKAYCKWDLNNSSGESQKSGTFDIEASNSYDVKVTAPSTAGDHKFVVKFYADEGKTDENLITEREMSVKVVEPVKITVTFENSGTLEVKFKAYLMIKDGDDWKRVDGSEKDVTVSGYKAETETKGTGTYTYDYVVKDLNRTTTYKVCTDTPIVKDKIGGLDKEMSFYTSQNNYSFITWFLVIVLIILIILIIWIYRKPVKNFGKPKGRK